MNQEPELSHEDSLRLNVLLCQDVNAIRINESNMMLYALLKDREVSIQLNPNCSESKYLKQVREFLAYQFLGSPAGYPVFMKRWTRMGQARDTNLAELLKLAEPEAVASVTHAKGLTMELAQYAWWSSQSVENARQMLHQPKVINSEFAFELAEFLIEFLPFEEEGKNIIDTVNLVLKNNLVDDKTKQNLWRKGKRKPAYFIGFILSIPDHLPDSELSSPHPGIETLKTKLAQDHNVYSQQLLRLSSQEGQHFINILERIISGIADQDAAISFIAAITAYFSEIRKESMTDSLAFDEFKNSRKNDQDLLAKQSAIYHLSLLEENNLNDILSRTNAVGTVLRRKLEPITSPILEHLKILKS